MIFGKKCSKTRCMWLFYASQWPEVTLTKFTNCIVSLRNEKKLIQKLFLKKKLDSPSVNTVLFHKCSDLSSLTSRLLPHTKRKSDFTVHLPSKHHPMVTPIDYKNMEFVLILELWNTNISYAECLERFSYCCLLKKKK